MVFQIFFVSYGSIFIIMFDNIFFTGLQVRADPDGESSRMPCIRKRRTRRAPQGGLLVVGNKGYRDLLTFVRVVLSFCLLKILS